MTSRNGLLPKARFEILACETVMNRSLRKWLIRLGVALTFLIIAVCGFLTWDWYATRSAGEARLVKVLAELEASEPGWRNLFAERNARLAPKERNAAYQIRDLWNDSPKALRDAVGKLPPDLRKQIEKAEPNQLLAGPTTEALRKTLSPHDAVLAEIRSRLSDTAGSGFPFDRAIGLTPTRYEWEVMTYLNLGRWLQSHARLCLADGRVDEAIADIRAMLGLCRGEGDQPTTIGQLKRMAVATMAVGALESCLGLTEPQNLDTLLIEFDLESRTPYAELLLRGERLGSDDLFAELDAGAPPDLRMGSPGEVRSEWRPTPFDRMNWALYRKYLPGQRAAAIEQSSQALDALRLPYRERLERFKALEKKGKMTVDSMFFALASVGVLRYVENETELVARLRTAVAAIACERYRQQFGHWPRDLGEIPKSILPAVPVDPFDDKPVRLAKTDTGLVAYSVGPDLSNDGGIVKKNATGGVDIGFRLYDLPQRRVP